MQYNPAAQADKAVLSAPNPPSENAALAKSPIVASTPTAAAESLSVENAAVLESFRQELVIAGYSPRTIKTYLFLVKDFLIFFNKDPKTTVRNDIVGFMVQKKEKDRVSPTTLALVHCALTFFFKNFLHSTVMQEIKAPKKDKKLPSVLTKEEVRELIGAAKRGRNRLIVQFLYSTGVRVSEAVKMKIEDLDLTQKMGKVKSGKGSKDRVIILSKNWCSDIKKYLKKRKVKSDYLFSKRTLPKAISTDTVQRIIREACEKAGIQKEVTPHTLRHSYATHLMESGENIRTIQELLGHASLATTQIYTHVSTEALKKVKNPFDQL